MHRVHHFKTSAEAYKASLDAGAVRQDDVLVITAERIVGLASTDPIAITVAAGALRALPALPRDRLLDELAHDEAAVGHAVDEAVRHGFRVATHFPAFGGLPERLTAGEAYVIFSLDDIAVATDAIDHRIAVLTRCAGVDTGEGAYDLFVTRTLDRLPATRKRLAAYARCLVPLRTEDAA